MSFARTRSAMSDGEDGVEDAEASRWIRQNLRLFWHGETARGVVVSRCALVSSGSSLHHLAEWFTHCIVTYCWQEVMVGCCKHSIRAIVPD
jgi:hypothetical protein